MKITNFCPSILTSHSEETVSMFKDLGFEIIHNDKAEEGIVGGSIRMKDDKGNIVDVTSSDHFPQDKLILHINVDDFDEGYKFFMDHGFHNALGKDVIVEAEHFKGAHLASPSGFEIMMMKHIRKD